MEGLHWSKNEEELYVIQMDLVLIIVLQAVLASDPAIYSEKKKWFLHCRNSYRSVIFPVPVHTV